MGETDDCSTESSSSFQSGVISLIWLIMVIVWYANSRHFNSLFVNALHKMIEATVFIKFLEVFFLFMAQVSCESKTFKEYWSLAYSCTFCLSNTFIFVTFLLISKGFCYTREYFDREEVNSIALATGGIYIIFSIYLMELGWIVILLIATVCYMWNRINRNSNDMILSLKQKITQMRRSNLINSLPAVSKKLSMIQSFSNIFQIYMVIYVFTYIWSTYLKFKSDHDKIALLNAVSEGNDLFGILATCLIFWPKFNGQFFDLAEFEGLEAGRGPLEMLESDGKGLDCLTENDSVFIVKQPFSQGDDYDNYLVAMSMTLRYHNPAQSDLEEPFINVV
jgi:hypothetical protein